MDKYFSSARLPLPMRRVSVAIAAALTLAATAPVSALAQNEVAVADQSRPANNTVLVLGEVLGMAWYGKQHCG